MKLLFVRDMKIPLCITLLALSCTLLIFAVGCNDSAVTEIEIQEQDQPELIPPSSNPEPPELVARYTELWLEIESKYGKTGTTDSAAVQEANQLAVELAKYDGPMAKVFEAIQIAVDLALESDSTGQSVEDTLDRNRIKKSYLTGSHCPSCKSREDCDRDCESKKKSSDTQTSWETVGSAAVCIGIGTTGEILSLATANLPGFFLSFGGKYVCLGTTVYNAYQSFSGNDDTYDQCMEKCRYKFPKLDGG